MKVTVFLLTFYIILKNHRKHRGQKGVRSDAYIFCLSLCVFYLDIRIILRIFAQQKYDYGENKDSQGRAGMD